MALKPEKRNLNPEDAFVPRSTIGEVAEASWNLAYDDNFLKARLRAKTIEEQNEQGDKFSAETINKEFGIGVSTPHTKLAAYTIQEAQRERAERMRVLKYAPDTFLSTAVSGGSSLAGAMSDPVDFTSGALLGIASGGVLNAIKAARAVKGATFTRALVNKIAKDSIYTRAIADNKVGRIGQYGAALIENGIVNGLTEMQVVRAYEAEQLEYTTGQALMNVVGGSFLMTSALHGGSAALSKLFQSGPRYVEAVFNTFEAGLRAGKNPGDALGIMLKEKNVGMEITDSILEATKNTFKTKAARYLEGSENLGEILEKVKMDVDDLKIDGTEIARYMDELESAGMNAKMLEHLEANPHANFSEDTILETKNNLLKEESNIGYDAHASETLKNTPEKMADEEFDVLDAGSVDIRINELKTRQSEGTLGEFGGEKLKEIETFAEKETERIDIFDSLAACFGYKL